MQNPTETTKKGLLQLLQKLDTFLDEPLTLVAIGGTALTLKGIKLSTRDIDLIVPKRKDYGILTELLSKLNFKELQEQRWMDNEGIIIDLYKEDYIINVQLLEPSLQRSDLVQEFQHITLRCLNPYDICITKIDRGDKRDLDDIKLIMEKTGIELKRLIRKYILTMEHSASENPKHQLLEFIRFIEKLGHTIDKEDIAKVQQWQKR